MGPLLWEKWHIPEYGLSVLILVVIKGPGDMTMVTAIYSNTGSDVLLRMRSRITLTPFIFSHV